MTTRLKPAAVEMMMSDNINEAIAKGISSTVDQQLSQLKEQLLALTTKVNGIETTYQKSAEALEKFATKDELKEYTKTTELVTTLDETFAKDEDISDMLTKSEASAQYATKADMNAKADKTYVDDTFQKKAG